MTDSSNKDNLLICEFCKSGTYEKKSENELNNMCDKFECLQKFWLDRYPEIICDLNTSHNNDVASLSMDERHELNYQLKEAYRSAGIGGAWYHRLQLLDTYAGLAGYVAGIEWKTPETRLILRPFPKTLGL